MTINKVLNQISEQEYRVFEQDGFLILRDCIDPTLIQKIKNFASDLLECKNSSQSIINAMEELESSNKSALETDFIFVSPSHLLKDLRSCR